MEETRVARPGRTWSMSQAMARLLEPVRRFPISFHAVDFLFGHLRERKREDALAIAALPRPLNAVLRKADEILAAEETLHTLQLRHRYDHPSKVWDGLRIFSFILHHERPDARLLDLGSGPHSNVLRWLELYGFRNLWAIDLLFQRPIRRGAIRYLGADVHETKFPDLAFDCAFAQSVIEHGIQEERLLREARRILNPGAHLLISTDFWPEKVDTSGLMMHGADWTIFSEPELRGWVERAERAGFHLVEPLDCAAMEPVIEVLGKRYTFAFFVLRKA